MRMDDFPGDGLPVMVEFGRSKNETLWHSEKNQAVIETVMITSGYGDLPLGTVLAKNMSDAGNIGKYLPYAPADFTDAESNLWKNYGRAYIIEDALATATSVKVSLADSYKFVVGDNLIIEDIDTAAEDLGAITTITRGMASATIEFTTATGADMEVDDFAAVRVKAGAATPWCDAFGVTSHEVSTGSGKYIAEAIPSAVIIMRAVLYINQGALGNLDTAAITALSGRVLNGKFLFGY
jgi:hypothetical protein